mmetsp:Transcript_21078/g.64205  ORF Transcript_21078/g.64205 Transcript_21078/m.64205 type:complete len:218 (+) Transcript_21078:1507-2160(+)
MYSHVTRAAPVLRSSRGITSSALPRSTSSSEPRSASAVFSATRLWSRKRWRTVPITSSPSSAGSAMYTGSTALPPSSASSSAGLSCSRRPRRNQCTARGLSPSGFALPLPFAMATAVDSLPVRRAAPARGLGRAAASSSCGRSSATSRTRRESGAEARKASSDRGSAVLAAAEVLALAEGEDAVAAPRRLAAAFLQKGSCRQRRRAARALAPPVPHP